MDWHIFGQQLWNGILNGATYVLFASGITLAFGVMRVINMAHGEIAMLGGYAVYEIGTKLGLGFWPAVVCALALTATAGVVLNRAAVQPMLRQSQLNVLLTTLAVSIVLLNGAEALFGTNAVSLSSPFSTTFHVIGVTIPSVGPAVVAAAAAAMLALYLFLGRSRLGRMTRATGQNVLGARVVGINTLRVYDYTLMISALMAGLAGIAVMMTSSADPTVGQPLLLIGFATVITAGMGSIGGAMVVGMWFGITGAMFSQYVSTSLSGVYIYATMIAILLLRPHGLFGERRASPLISA